MIKKESAALFDGFAEKRQTPQTPQSYFVI